MFIFLSIFLASKYKIKLYHTEEYLTNDFDNRNMVILGDISKSDVFIFFWDNNTALKKFIYPIKYKGKTLTVDTKTSELSYDNLQGGDSQTFVIIPVDFYDRSFMIIKDGLCLTWIKKERRFSITVCNEGDESQIFGLVAQNFDYDHLNNIDRDLVKRTSKSSTSTILSNLVSKKNQNVLQGIYRSLYDISLCLGNNGICHPENDLCKAKTFSANYSSGYGSSNQASQFEYSHSYS